MPYRKLSIWLAPRGGDEYRLSQTGHGLPVGAPMQFRRKLGHQDMARIGDGADLLKCSFCGKSQKQVKKLIAGPGVYICDECIDLCNEIIEEELAETSET